MIWPFGRKRQDGASPSPPGQGAAAPPRVMADFFREAEREIQGLIDQDPQWFSHLPYQGAMSKDQARQFEVEKRALWRRVIHDAQRSDLPGLRWETRQDKLVCDECRQLEGRVFARQDFAELAALVMHLGCRCELTPWRQSPR